MAWAQPTDQSAITTVTAAVDQLRPARPTQFTARLDNNPPRWLKPPPVTVELRSGSCTPSAFAVSHATGIPATLVRTTSTLAVVKSALDRESPVPLYQQLADVLRQDIAGGWLSAGVAFLSGRKLTARHPVTRTTVRSALRGLNQEGSWRPSLRPAASSEVPRRIAGGWAPAKWEWARHSLPR